MSLRQCGVSGKDSSYTEQLFYLGVLPLPCVWLLQSVLGPLPDLGSSRTLVPRGCANPLPSEEDMGCHCSCTLAAVSVNYSRSPVFFSLVPFPLQEKLVLFFFLKGWAKSCP